MLKTVKKIVRTITYNRNKFIDTLEWHLARTLLLKEDKQNGHWVCMYSGIDILSSNLVDVDHIVPLKYSWINGASKWTEEKRHKFATDNLNLFVTSQHENRSKGDDDLTEYLPNINKEQYVDRWEKVCQKYEIKLSKKELEIIQKYKKSA